MASGEKKRIGGKVVYIRKAQRTPPVSTNPPARDPANFKSASEAENLNELSTYMSDKHGVSINSNSLSGQDFKSVKNAAGEIEAVINEFPQAKSAFSELRGDNLRPGALANARLSGIITTSNSYFSDDSELQSRYGRSVDSGFHPVGTTGNHVVTHESGHILEAALINKNITYENTGPWYQLERSHHWGKSTYAKQVISEAAKAAKKTPDGKGKKNTQLISDVSGYAQTNRSETLAECVADYRANGSNAKPLSREVWKILKRELG